MARGLDKEYVYNSNSPAGQREIRIRATYLAPIVVIIQYGGWQAVDYDDPWQTPWTDAFIAEGFSVIGINWRFAPGATYETAMQDIDLAIRTAYTKMVNFNRVWGRPSEIPLNIIGMSSGGHLAVQYAINRATYSKNSWRSNLITRVIGLAGVYDLNDATLGETANNFINSFISDPTWKTPASPITYAPTAAGDSVEYLLMHGNDDTLLPVETQAQAMYDAVAATAPSKINLIRYSDIGHEIGQNTSPGWEDRFRTIVHFFRTGEAIPHWLFP